MTRICVPLFLNPKADVEALILSAEEALDGVDGMIELRCDQATPKQMLEAIDLARLPLIVTIRPTWEGGFSQKSDKDRLAMWEDAMEAGADHIDVELQAWEQSKPIRETVEDLADKTGARIILSNHSFGGRPADLADRLARLRAVKPARILKLAWKAESLLDALDALRFTAENPKADGRPLVALAMGEEGLLSRLLARKFAAPFTFAAAEPGKESAPGQPTVDDLVHLYRWNIQNPATQTFGVVGWPVAHSKSPHIHNAALAAANLNAVYVPFAIRESYEAFAAAIDALRSLANLHLSGLSVTIPHKENALRYAAAHAAAIDPLTAHIGVANTLIFPAPVGGSKAPIRAMNSDYAGALDALVAAWGGTDGSRESVAGKRIAVLGAGGAARAIVAGLADAHATVVIYNRTHEKAEGLAAAFNSPSAKVVAAPWDKLPQSCCDAFINCTPIGMHPHVNASPLDPITTGPCPWSAATIVFDTVYNPPLTQFLKRAKKAGATIIPGSEMFIRQAAIQFTAFTNLPAPIPLFRQILSQSK